MTTSWLMLFTVFPLHLQHINTATNKNQQVGRKSSSESTLYSVSDCSEWLLVGVGGIILTMLMGFADASKSNQVAFLIRQSVLSRCCELLRDKCWEEKYFDRRRTQFGKWLWKWDNFAQNMLLCTSVALNGAIIWFLSVFYGELNMRC